MEEVIKKAIEGGYKPDDVQPWLNKETVLDHLFWQSLGKALCWGAYCLECDSVVKIWEECLCDEDEVTPRPEEEWLFRAKKFHEINLTQGWNEAEKWLQNLIKE